MLTKGTLDKVRNRVLKRLPDSYKSMIEVEIKRVEEEATLEESILMCTDCPLSESCTKKVIGTGPMDAGIMVIGAAPGRNEDEEGSPFVGEGGQLLMKAFESVGWKREDLYLTNLVKCHPPGNRNPLVSEVGACYKHLLKEIELVNPKVIISIGSVASSTIIHPDFKITQENGKWFELTDSRRSIAIYDPSYLLRMGEGTERQNLAKWDVYNALMEVKKYQDSGFKDV